VEKNSETDINPMHAASVQVYQTRFIVLAIFSLVGFIVNIAERSKLWFRDEVRKAAPLRI
jgi:hypothetical protein